MKQERRLTVMGCLTILLATIAGFLIFPGRAGGITAAGTRIRNVTSVSCEMYGQQLVFNSDSAIVDILQVNRLSIAPPRVDLLVPGKPLTFAHTIRNLGNISDTFNLEVSGSSGLTVQFLSADGTPLTDTSGDGIIDTGPLPSGAEAAIVIKVTAPQDAQPVDRQLTITATSAADRAASAALVDTATVEERKFTSVQTVTPPGQTSPGSELTYRLDFGTDAKFPATNVVISDPLDPNLDYIEGSATLPAGLPGATTSYDAASRTVYWYIPSVPNGYRGSIMLRTRVNPATGADTTISNAITISSDDYPERKLSNSVKTPVVEQPLRVTMTATRKEAEIGEFVGYSVTVENVSKSVTAERVALLGTLPRGFRYAKGSSALENLHAADPATGTTTRWELGSLEHGEKKTLSYRAVVSVDSPLGDAFNYAMATGVTPGGSALVSPTAGAKVKIMEGALNDRAIILGRVFVDSNRDLMPDGNERGIQGVRLYLENGFYAVTDAEGKFTLVGIDPGEHVLKLDKSTLPRGLKPVPMDTSFAGDGGSRFITVPFGGVGRGDFALQESASGASLPRPEQSAVPGEERVLTFGTKPEPASLPLEEQILSMPSSAGILQPLNGASLRKPWTDIVVRMPDGAEHTVRVNGTPLPHSKIGKSIVESKGKIRICQYVGVQLEPGTNRLALEVIPPDAGPQVVEIEIVAPGEAVKVELSPARADIPADGKSVTPFTVNFLDGSSHRARGNIVYTVVTEKAEIVEPDLDPAKPGHQLQAVDGKGTFRIRSTANAGPERVAVVAGTDLAGGADVFFIPQMRDWVVAGIGSFTAGSNSVTGNKENLPDQDLLQQGFNQQGRIAFFAKGSFLDEYLVTAAYDSEKEKRTELFQRVPPDRYYPMLGDASGQGYDAESRQKYYLRVEKDHSYVLAGDFNTNLSSNEFSRYDRSFNGVKADIDTKNVTFRAFGASTHYAANREEIPANGTSGYYFLKNSRIIENTDKISIEVRDRYHSERVLSSTVKTPYTDYSIDYRTGGILFREPIPSYDPNLNPIRIVALYESEDPGDENHVYGGRGALRNEKGELGLTAVIEEAGDSINSLYGIDGLWNLTGGTALSMEAARSNTVEKGEDIAWKAGVRTQVEKAMVDAYYRKVGRDFKNLSMTGSETGTEKYGAKASYPLMEKTKLFAESFVQSDLFNNTDLQSTSLAVSTQLDRFTVDSGYRFVRGDDGNGETVSEQMVSAGISGKLTAKLEGALLQEQAFSSDTVRDYPSRTLLKLNYKLSDRTSAFVTEEYRESGNRKGNNTVMGISHQLFSNVIVTTDYRETSGSGSSRQLGSEVSSKWEPSKELSFTTRSGYQLQDSMTGGRGQALIGVDGAWEAMKGVRIGAKAERVQVMTGSNDPTGVNTALALSVAFLAREDLKGTARYEYRRSPGETAQLSTLGGAWKLTESLSLLGKANLWWSEKPTGDDVLFDAQVGGAYRPLGRNSLYLLSMLRFKEDSQGSVPGGQKTKSMIASVELSDRLRPNLTLHGKYAGKYTLDTLWGEQLHAYSDMVIAGATYDLTDRLDVDVSARLMNQYDSGVSTLAVIPQVGYRIVKNVRLAVGYNYARLNDRDLAGEEYTSSGPFVQLKFKFDENTIEGLYTGIFGKPAAVSAPPPSAPPATRPLMAVVKAVLTEEPVEVVGSAETLKLLVNDQLAAFPSGDVKLGMVSVDEVLELKGSEPAPLQFQVEASVPEKIASWSVAVSTLSGNVIHVIRGEGAPAQVVWDIGKEGGVSLKGGEIYQYRLEVRYADGSAITSPFRLFGVNRTSSIALSLTGGAFSSGSAALGPKAKATLKKAAALLRKYPGEKVVVEGHSDAEEEDAELSRRRSQAAAYYLVEEEEIAHDRVIVRWFGNSRPLASNAIAEGRDLNRRVEIKGELSESRRAAVVERRREEPFVRINRKALAVGELGRFSGSVEGGNGSVEVEMGNSDGRSVKTALELPEVTLLDPASGRETPVACPDDQAGDLRKPLKVTHRFLGKTKPGQTVSVDGKGVAVAADGSFAFTLDLPEGVANYWLQVRSAEGYSRQYRLTVTATREGKP